MSLEKVKKILNDKIVECFNTIRKKEPRFKSSIESDINSADDLVKNSVPMSYWDRICHVDSLCQAWKSVATDNLETAIQELLGICTKLASAEPGPTIYCQYSKIVSTLIENVLIRAINEKLLTDDLCKTVESSFDTIDTIANARFKRIYDNSFCFGDFSRSVASAKVAENSDADENKVSACRK